MKKETNTKVLIFVSLSLGILLGHLLAFYIFFLIFA